MMFRAIITKTLYDKRWAILAWSLGFAAIIIFTVVLYPSFKDPKLLEAFKNLPQELQSFAGSFDINTIDKYLDGQVFFNNATFLLIILGISLGVNFLSTEEERGTIQDVLATPITRSRFYIEKFITIIIYSIIVVIAGLLGTIVGLLFIGEWVNVLRLLQIGIMMVILTVLYGSFSLSVGAITGSKRLAIAVPTAVTVVMYILYTFSFAVSKLKGWEKLTWNYYFSHSQAVIYGINYTDLTVLLILILLFFGAGWYFFNKRDLHG